MKHHFIPLHIVAFCITVLFISLFFTGSRTEIQTTHAKVNPYMVSLAADPDPQLRAFTGTWYSHAAALIIQSNGHATYVARVYSWCNTGAAPPCDVIEGNNIISGIRMELRFTHTRGDTAYGTVIKSTTDHVGSPVSLTLAHNHTANFQEVTSKSPRTLCDLQAPAGRCGA